MPVSKKRKRRPPTTRLRCPDCDAVTNLDRRRYASAIHDCRTGTWQRITHRLARAIAAADDETAARLLGVTVDEYRRRLEYIRERRAGGAA